MNNIAEVDKTKLEVVADEEQALAVQEPSIMGLLADAVKDPDFDADKLGQLIMLKERVDATEAKKAFQDAMFEFHMDPPEIVKKKPVFGKDKSKGAQYFFADFGATVKVVRPKLLAVGIVATWESEPLENGVTKVTCMLRHRLGHEERSSMAGTPEMGGSKNAIQGVGSTDHYLRRYTYLSVTGLVAEGEDNDGIIAFPVEPEDADKLESLADEVGADKARLCKYFKCASIRDIPASKYYEAEKMLEKKRGKK